MNLMKMSYYLVWGCNKKCRNQNVLLTNICNWESHSCTAATASVQLQRAPDEQTQEHRLVCHDVSAAERVLLIATQLSVQTTQASPMCTQRQCHNQSLYTNLLEVHDCIERLNHSFIFQISCSFNELLHNWKFSFRGTKQELKRLWKLSMTSKDVEYLFPGVFILWYPSQTQSLAVTDYLS